MLGAAPGLNKGILFVFCLVYNCLKKEIHIIDTTYCSRSPT